MLNLGSEQHITQIMDKTTGAWHKTRVYEIVNYDKNNNDNKNKVKGKGRSWTTVLRRESFSPLQHDMKIHNYYFLDRYYYTWSSPCTTGCVTVVNFRVFFYSSSLLQLSKVPLYQGIIIGNKNNSLQKEIWCSILTCLVHHWKRQLSSGTYIFVFFTLLKWTCPPLTCNTQVYAVSDACQTKHL